LCAPIGCRLKKDFQILMLCRLDEPEMSIRQDKIIRARQGAEHRYADWLQRRA